MHLNPPPGMSLHVCKLTSTSTTCPFVYKLPPYLTMCGHHNLMSLLQLWSQSRQYISTHMLTIDDNNQRDTYDSRVYLYCPSGVTGSEIHLILECPATSHVALDLIHFLTTLLYDTCQPNHNKQTKQPNHRKSQRMGFLVTKNGFWPQNQIFPGKKINVEFQPVPTERLLHSRSKRQETSTQGRTERMNPSAEACCTIEGCDPKFVT